MQYLRQLRYDSLLSSVRPFCIDACSNALLFSCARWPPSLLAGCGSKDDSEPAVATPSLTLSRERVPIGSPLKLTYRFDVAPNAKIDGDYWVFVHVLEPDGEQLWIDDHLPPTPTSTWKPGQKVEYTRTVFVPNYPYIGPAVVRLGLYDPKTSKRLTLAGEEASRKEYQVAKFELQPQSENIFLIYKEGWHPAEVVVGRSQHRVAVDQEVRHDLVPEPEEGRDGLLEYAARIDKFTPPQQVTVRIGDQPIGTLRGDVEGPDARHVPGHRRPVRAGRRRGARHRRRQDVHARRLRYA